MEVSLDPPYLIVKPGVKEEDFYRLADEDSDRSLGSGKRICRRRSSA